MPPRHRVPRAQGRPYRRKRALLKRDAELCYLCGQPIDMALKFPDPGSFSAHHDPPLSHGGRPDGAIYATHLRCNQRHGKGTKQTKRVDSVDW